jgi:hypothetical protein
MSRVTTEIVDITGDQVRSLGRTTAKTLGAIVVKPPIQVGTEFNHAVLGKDRYHVDLKEVVSTNEATVLLAEADGGTIENRQGAIQTIAERIGQLANAPETVLQMMEQNPFPIPKER